MEPGNEALIKEAKTQAQLSLLRRMRERLNRYFDNVEMQILKNGGNGNGNVDI